MILQYFFFFCPLIRIIDGSEVEVVLFPLDDNGNLIEFGIYSNLLIEAVAKLLEGILDKNLTSLLDVHLQYEFTKDTFYS